MVVLVFDVDMRERSCGSGVEGRADGIADDVAESRCREIATREMRDACIVAHLIRCRDDENLRRREDVNF